jgi:hypothetical protein
MVPIGWVWVAAPVDVVDPGTALWIGFCALGDVDPWLPPGVGMNWVTWAMKRLPLGVEMITDAPPRATSVAIPALRGTLATGKGMALEPFKNGGALCE